MGHSKSKLRNLRSHVLRCQNCKALKRVLSLDNDNFHVNTPVTVSDNDRATLLWIAARWNDMDVVRHLLSLGADVSQACGPLQMTPLHLATHNRNPEMASLFLRAGANPNVMDRWNYTPLMYAAIHHEPLIVEDFFRLFIWHKCDVNFGACLNDDGVMEQPWCNTDLVELDSGYSSNYITYIREPLGPVSGTALHLAIQNPHLPNETVQMLLDRGAMPDKPNLYGQSALMGAVLDIYYDYHMNVKGHLELLISHGASINMQDKRGWTAMHYACQRGSMTCIRQLMKTGADSDMISSRGETPLWLLLILGWREAARFMLANGCDMDRPIKSSVVLYINQNAEVCRYGLIRPLEFAVCNRYYNLAERMVALGARVTSDIWLGNDGETASARNLEFKNFLKRTIAARSDVRSLKEYCREVIRSTIGNSICLKAEQLCLPQSLNEYISFAEIP